VTTRALLEAGADVGARDDRGKLPADLAFKAVRSDPVFRELYAAYRN